MTDTDPLSKVAIILNRPRFPENIGAAARAMRNMGLTDLIIVDPENCDLTRVCRLATHAALDVIENMQVFDDLETALQPFGFVVGTTARLGGERRVVVTPSRMVGKIMPLLAKNRVGLVFGPEDRGLENEEIRLCHLLVNIPTAKFSSLNLAQAVMVLCYELFQGTRPSGQPWTPRLATRHELDGMYDQVTEILVRIDYINPQNPDYFMNKIRQFFTRLQLRAKEVSIIRGICRQINWYGQECHARGLRGDPDPVRSPIGKE